MTYLILFAITFSTMLSSSDASEPIVFKKSQKMLLEADHAKWLKAEAIPAWQLEIEGVKQEISIKKPYSFFKGKVGKGHLVIIIKDVKAKYLKLTPEQIEHILGIDTEEDSDNFETMETIGANGETDLAYCSCGGSTFSKEGDGCFFYADPPLVLCDGECSGDQSDYDCGVTLVDFTPGSPPKKILMN